VFKTLVEYITEVEAVSNPEGTILSVIQLIKKTAEGSGDATKFSMPRFLNHLKNAGLDIDYAGFKGYYDASPSIQNSIGQFTEKEISFGSDEDSESSETMGKPEGKMPPAEKVAQMANRAVKARESASDSLMDVENPVKEEVELDEAKNYEIKNGKIHISKANFRKVHKDYKNSTKGKERMMALDPKSGATTSYEVVFEEVELDEVGGAAFGGTIDKIQKVVDDKTAMKIDGVMVDTFTASLIMNIFKKVNKQNQDKMRKMKVTQLANAAYKLSGMKEEVELEEGGSGDAPISKMSRAELIDYLGTTDAEVANMSDDELRDAANEKTMDMQSVDNNQPAVEETVEVPVQALEELLQLAGYTDYKSKVEEYSNEPEEAVADTETQLIGLSGGLNRPKKQFAKAQDGDNAMAVEANETNESQETAIESFYKKYDEFVQSLNKQD